MFTQLLVPLDQSALAEAAIARAVALVHATGARLDLLLVHEPFTIGGRDDAPVNSRQCASEEAYLDRMAREVISGATIKPTWALLNGRPVEMICRRAADVGADLIVMTSHGRTGFNRAWLGSVADGVIRRSHIPVLLLRSTDAQRADRSERLFSHALVLIDASAESERIIDDALAVARAGKGHITLLHIVQPVPLVIPEYGVPVAGAPRVVDIELTERVAAEA
ncbi:MAG TPA: universal stress protein, partial [Gemmatimonadaceae bacterium]